MKDKNLEIEVLKAVKVSDSLLLVKNYAIVKLHELACAYGMLAVMCATTECFEKGLISGQDEIYLTTEGRAKLKEYGN